MSVVCYYDNVDFRMRDAGAQFPWRCHHKMAAGVHVQCVVMNTKRKMLTGGNLNKTCSLQARRRAEFLYIQFLILIKIITCKLNKFTSVKINFKFFVEKLRNSAGVLFFAQGISYPVRHQGGIGLMRVRD